MRRSTVKFLVWTTLSLLLAGGGTFSIHADEDAYLEAPQHVGPPRLPDHAVNNRAFQGIPSMAIAPGGRLWANWYAGVTPGEDKNNYVVVSTSGDEGQSWREVLIIDPDGPGPVRTYDPELWLAPNGRLYVFWAQAIGHEGSVAGVWCVHTDTPDRERPEWSPPQRLTDGIMMCKPIVLSTGEWMLPASTWRKTDNSARVVVSEDEGKTWKIRGACNIPAEDRQFDEHMLIERQDGSLWMLIRTKYGIGESISTDGGRTWPDATPTNIPHPSARFFITRLISGNLLLVKHGPMDQKTGRSHLTAFVSEDDGKSWTGGLLLDERSGVSYPDGQQTADGRIRIIYDYSRTGSRHILLATFREEDVQAGENKSGTVQLRQLVSEASGGQEKPKPDPKPVKPNEDGEALRLQQPGQFATKPFTSVELSPAATIFTDRNYAVAELPDVLKQAHFLRVPLEGEKVLQCTQAGTVWLLTPTPERNRDSQTKTLTEQGFRKVALPEVRLFNPNSSGNYCTLYQKDCQAGEEIHIGKWAVPVWRPVN